LKRFFFSLRVSCIQGVVVIVIYFKEELHSPNGSCLASVQTIHSHPPARTVCIVEPEKEVVYLVAKLTMNKKSSLNVSTI
jgi:hypothetical protein